MMIEHTFLLYEFQLQVSILNKAFQCNVCSSCYERFIDYNCHRPLKNANDLQIMSTIKPNFS